MTSSFLSYSFSNDFSGGSKTSFRNFRSTTSRPTGTTGGPSARSSTPSHRVSAPTGTTGTPRSPWRTPRRPWTWLTSGWTCPSSWPQRTLSTPAWTSSPWWPTCPSSPTLSWSPELRSGRRQTRRKFEPTDRVWLYQWPYKIGLNQLKST